LDKTDDLCGHLRELLSQAQRKSLEGFLQLQTNGFGQH